MDVCLTNYGHCSYISGKHACIFYDEVRLSHAAPCTASCPAATSSICSLLCVCVCLCMCLCVLQNTKHYELLNYSEHGTTVDNVLYSCDFSEKALPAAPSSLVARVQGLIRKLSTTPHIRQKHCKTGFTL